MKKSADIKEKKLSFFDFLGSINEGSRSKDLLADIRHLSSEAVPPDSPEKAYVPFMVNRGLSYHQDTVLFANEMNMRAGIPSRMQYDFLRLAIRPRRRFSKWFKREDSEDLAIIKKACNFSSEKARQALPLFTKKELQKLYDRYDQGGKS